MSFLSSSPLQLHASVASGSLSAASLTSALCSPGPGGAVGPGCSCDPFAPLSSSGAICAAGYACSVPRNASAYYAAAPSGAPESGLSGLLTDLKGLGLSGPEAVATLRGMGLSTKDLASGLGVDAKALTAALEGDGSPTDKLAAAAAALGSGKGTNAALAAAASAILESVDQGNAQTSDGQNASLSTRQNRETAEDPTAAAALLNAALAAYASPSPSSADGFESGSESESESMRTDPAELASALLAAAAEPGGFLATSGLFSGALAPGSSARSTLLSPAEGPAGASDAASPSSVSSSSSSSFLQGRCEACALGQYCPAGTAVRPLEGTALQRAVRDLQCPPGSYCPSPAYALPCPEGSFCPRGAVTPVTCDLRALLAGAPTFPLPTREVDVQTGILLDGSPLAGNMCPAGSAKPLAACAAGFYCPTPGTELLCPAGHYCRKGSAAPARCPALTNCPAGSSVPARSLLGLVTIPAIALAALVAALAVHGLVLRSRQRAAKTYRARERLWRLLVPAFGPGNAGGGGGANGHGAALTQRSKPPALGRATGGLAPPAPTTVSFVATALQAGSHEGLSTPSLLGPKTPLAGLPAPPLPGSPIRAGGAATPAHSVGLSGPPPPPALRGFGLIRPRLSIEFRDLVVELRDGRQLLCGVSGRFRHSRVAAIMGPSGAGKSTLLGALMGGSAVGFARGTRMRGQVLVNGRVLGSEVLSSVRGYVPQEDVVHEDLTVRENLAFSAALRLSADKSAAERQAIVEDAIDALNLRACAHQIVGGDDARGVSGGQRKRVSIGVELVAKPSILFMDEPTSGLDSTGAADVLSALKRAAQRGMNVVAVLHQPRAAIFALFDDLALLAAGGRMAYAGPGDLALPYFEALGFRLPPHENPADFFLDVVSGVLPREGDPNFHPHALADAWESLGEGWVRGRAARRKSRVAAASDDARGGSRAAFAALGGAATEVARSQTISTQIAFGAVTSAGAAAQRATGQAADASLSRGAWPVSPDRLAGGGGGRSSADEGSPLRPAGESSDASLDAPLNASLHAPVADLLDPASGGSGGGAVGAPPLPAEVSLLSAVSSSDGRGEGKRSGDLGAIPGVRFSEEQPAPAALPSDSTLGSLPDPSREFSRDLPAPGNAARTSDGASRAAAFSSVPFPTTGAGASAGGDDGFASCFPSLRASGFETIPLRGSGASARMDGEQLSLLLEAFREADVDRRNALTSVQLGKLLRSLGIEPDEEDLAAALEELSDPRCGDRIPRAALLAYVLSGGTRNTRSSRSLGGVPGSLYGARGRHGKGKVLSAASVHRVYSIEGYHDKRHTPEAPDRDSDKERLLGGGSGAGNGGFSERNGLSSWQLPREPASDAPEWLVAGSEHPAVTAGVPAASAAAAASRLRSGGTCTRFQELSPDGVAVLAVSSAAVAVRATGETQRRDTIESLADSHAPVGPRPDGWLPGSCRGAATTPLPAPPASRRRRNSSSFSDEDVLSLDASTSYDGVDDDDQDDGDSSSFGNLASRGGGAACRSRSWEAGDRRAPAPLVEDAHLAAYVSSYVFDASRGYGGSPERAHALSPPMPQGSPGLQGPLAPSRAAQATSTATAAPVLSRFSREVPAPGSSPPLASGSGAMSGRAGPDPGSVASNSSCDAHSSSFGADKGWAPKGDLASRSSSALSSSVSSSPGPGGFGGKPAAGPTHMMLPLHFTGASDAPVVLCGGGAGGGCGGDRLRSGESACPLSMEVAVGSGLSGAARASPVRRRTSSLRRVPGKVRQLCLLLHRAVLKTQRGWATRAVDAFLLVFAGVVIGCIHGTDHQITDVRGRFALVLLAVGIICVCSSLGAFGRDRLVALRERRSGVGPGARWLAVELAALPEALLAPFVFSSVYYSLTIPSLGFARLYSVCALAAWWAAGVGHLVSVSVAPENALVAAVAVVMVVGGFVNGVSPPYRNLAPLFKRVTAVSYNRWLVEAAAVMEFERLPSWLAPELRTILFTAGHCGLDAYPLPSSYDDAELEAYRGIPLDPDALCKGAIPRAVVLVLVQGLVLRLLTLAVSICFPRGVSLEPLCLGVGDAVGSVYRKIKGEKQRRGQKIA